MNILTMLLMLAFSALAVRFTILGTMITRRGSRPLVLGLLGALITFDIIELICRWKH